MNDPGAGERKRPERGRGSDKTMSDVFISYKTEDGEQAHWLRDVLEQNGISC